jgi:hypothetical protein
MSDIDIQLQWHSPDQCFAAVLMRDGEAWYLGGALVGMGAPGEAVDNLLDQAFHLVVVGENFLTEDPISLEDRLWLFKLLDGRIDSKVNDEMYQAVRAANGGKDPYA